MSSARLVRIAGWFAVGALIAANSAMGLAMRSIHGPDRAANIALMIALMLAADGLIIYCYAAHIRSVAATNPKDGPQPETPDPGKAYRL